MWRLVYFIPICSFFLLLRLAFFVLGLILIPIATFSKAYKTRKSKIFPDKNIWAWTWWFMYPWGNEEDGLVAGLEYIDKPLWFRIIYWTMIRNPANNLRFIPFFSAKIDPTKVDYILRKTVDGIPPLITRPYLEQAEETPPLTYLCWQGIWRANYRVEFKMFGTYWRFWIGNCKVYPSDIYGVRPNSYRRYGAGPVTQFKKLK